MYVAKIKLNQSSCSLAYATQDGKFSMQIMEYILLNDQDAVFLCRIDDVDGDLNKYFEIMERHESTKFLQILEKTPTNLDFIAVVRDTTGIKAFEECYCFIKPPIKIRNGNKYYTVFAPDIVHLKRAYEKLKKIGRWEVLEVKAKDSVKSPLTNSQKRVLEIAYKMGYFSKRRGVNIQQIADALGLSKSTVHKHLKDALSRIVDDFIERHVEPPEIY
ncbi:MAG: helix-turn-helix domain-containing protein [Archaeoglobus sp.]|nr:helix-turn-helix domain-containing protein [Archaeoglobus sp.]